MIFAGCDQIAMQMVERRYSLCDTQPWGAVPAQSEIVLIASRGESTATNCSARLTTALEPVTIAFGLAFATVLTLLFVPVLYTIFFKIPSPAAPPSSS